MESKLNGLPVYRAELMSEDDGIVRVSLVDAPAVESRFQAFEKQERVQTYAVANEEKRIVRGVLMRADFPIYRREGDVEYYLVFRAEDIRKMAERFLFDNRQNRVNLMHEAGTEVPGVHLLQLFIKDKAAGIAPAGFDEIEEGSLFGEYHVTNDEVWAKIKDGTYRGFSIEAYHTIMRSETTNQNAKNMGLKAILKKVLVQFGAVTTDNGVLIWEGDEDLKEGYSVYLEEDGERKPAADGDYKTEDGKTIKVAGGKVSEIVDVRAEVEAKEQTKAAEADPASDAKEQEDELWAMYNKLADRVKALEGKVDGLESSKSEMAEQLDKMSKTPAAKPAHEEYNEAAGAGKTGDRGLDNALRIVGAK